MAGPAPGQGVGKQQEGGTRAPNLPPQSPPSLAGKGDGGLGPDAALQRLVEETDRIQPSAPDAVARLKSVVRELIDLERAQQREIAALQSAPAAAASPVRRRARKKSAPAPATASAADAPVRSAAAAGGAQAASGTALITTPAATGMLFGKRGLKKVHRAGCIFGERIKAEDRVYFKSMQEAAAAGYAPCKICHPDR